MAARVRLEEELEESQRQNGLLATRVGSFVCVCTAVFVYVFVGGGEGGGGAAIMPGGGART